VFVHVHSVNRREFSLIALLKVASEFSGFGAVKPSNAIWPRLNPNWVLNVRLSLAL
jgi:hypothetical protein